jgi:putative redox protein
MRQVKGDTLRTEIKREISFGEGCPADQVERLLVIAQKCPVSKILVGEIIINTNHIEF